MRIAFSCFFLSTISLGASVVKVESRPCGSSARVRQGSGVLVETKSGARVITSSHVVFHGGDREQICHRIVAPWTASARLQAVDFTRGLALLHPEAVPADAAVVARPSRTASNGAALALEGFPSASSAALREPNGVLLNAASDRGLLPRVPRLWEVSGHSEYGMSGGAALFSDGSLAGILSHQYLAVLAPGQPGRVGEYGPGRLPQNALLAALVIPASIVSDWLSALETGTKDADLREDLDGQLRKSGSSFGLGGIRFLQQNAKGGDGVGIGGEDDEEGAPPGPIVLDLDPSPSPQPWPFPESDWRTRALQRIRAGAVLAITGLEKGGARRSVASLPQALTGIQRGWRPLLRVIRSSTDDLGAAERQLRTAADDLDRLVRSVPDDRIGARELRQDLALIAEKARNGQPELLSEGEFQRILEPASGSLTEQAWNGWFASAFDEATEARALLIRLRATAARLRL